MSLDRLSASASAAALRFTMGKWQNTAFEKPLSVSQKLARVSGGDGKGNKSWVQNDSSSLVFSLQQSQLSSNVMSAVNRAGKRLSELQSQKSYTMKQQVVEITTVIRTNMPVDESVSPEDASLLPKETVAIPITRSETKPSPKPEVSPVSVESLPVSSPPVVDSTPVAPGNSGNTSGGAHSAKEMSGNNDSEDDSSIKHHGQGYYKNHGIDEVDYKNKGNGKSDSVGNNGKSNNDSTSVVSVAVVSTVESGSNAAAPKASSSSVSTLTMNVTVSTGQTVGSVTPNSLLAGKPSVSKMAESVETQRMRKMIQQANEEGSLEERSLTRHLEIVSAVLSSGILAGAIGNTPLDLYVVQDKSFEQPDKSVFTVSESA